MEGLLDSVRINGAELIRKPGINYAIDYWKIPEECKEFGETAVIKSLIENDLFFVLYFIIKPFSDAASADRVNSKFVVERCHEVESGPASYTLDVWARYHYKTSIMAAEIVQYALKNPEHAQGILSFKASVAKNMLFAIKSAFENVGILQMCFPDVVWTNPFKDAPRWSLDEGIILKRIGNRREPTIGAYGLVEGMPTALHFERRTYDDISTQDMASSPTVMEDVKMKFDISMNLKTMTSDRHRIMGTFYNHCDPLVYIRDKKKMDDTPLYHFRKHPATHDGTANGIPVLMTQEEFDLEKRNRGFNCMQLCDPSPSQDIRLNPDYLKIVDILPSKLYRFMLVDPAGRSATEDAWAMAVIGVEPQVDDIGASNIFILDMFIQPLEHSEAIQQICQMYLRNGFILKLGIETPATDTTDMHVMNALKAHGRHLSEEGGSLVRLRNGGRDKTDRILSALQWPLNNGKIHIHNTVPAVFIDRLKHEMLQFPYWHEDGLDMVSYIFDIMRDYNFARRKSTEQKFATSGLSRR
jgi:hypothetical protein